jgi:hypothetical protein
MLKSALVLGCCLIAAIAVSGPAFAQTETMPPPKSQRTIPEKDPSANSGSNTNLSKKLDRTNGVIAPPSDVDPGIQKSAPVPNPNSTRVIPPPTGGVQAK